MIEGFLQPKRASTIELPVNCMRRGPFDSLHDLGKRRNHSPFFVGQWGENQVHMIRHHNRDVEVVFRIVIMSAAVQHDLSCPLGQDTTVFGAESNKVRPVVLLNVRKVTSRKGHKIIFIRRSSSRDRNFRGSFHFRNDPKDVGAGALTCPVRCPGHGQVGGTLRLRSGQVLPLHVEFLVRVGTELPLVRARIFDRDGLGLVSEVAVSRQLSAIS
jgi:hypothetical protein